MARLEKIFKPASEKISDGFRFWSDIIRWRQSSIIFQISDLDPYILLIAEMKVKSLLCRREDHFQNRREKKVKKKEKAFRCLIPADKIGSDKMSGENKIGSYTFHNGSDIIWYI